MKMRKVERKLVMRSLLQERRLLLRHHNKNQDQQRERMW